MLRFGLLSSTFDYLTFGLLFWVLRARQELLHIGWFVESVPSAPLVAQPAPQPDRLIDQDRTALPPAAPGLPAGQRGCALSPEALNAVRLDRLRPAEGSPTPLAQHLHREEPSLACAFFDRGEARAGSTAVAFSLDERVPSRIEERARPRASGRSHLGVLPPRLCNSRGEGSN
jgi:hypothetical protein